MQENKNSLIINGKSLAKIGHKPASGGDSSLEERKFRRSLGEARKHMTSQLKRMVDRINEVPSKYRLNNLYFKINYPKEFLAKSYQVRSIYNEAGLSLVGSSTWLDDNEDEGRSDFLSGTQEEIDSFRKLIENTDIKIQQKEIRRMEEISLLEPLFLIDNSEMAQDHLDIYEMVFHAIEDLEEFKTKFEELTNLGPDEYSLLEAENGIVFITAKLSKENREKVAKFNPLRSGYPVNNRDFTSASFANEPVVNSYNLKNMQEDEINQLPWVGLIDGGVSLNNPFFKTVEQIHESRFKSSGEYKEHGTSVASVILYGDLSKEEDKEIGPSFRIQSIRALPSDKDIEFNLLTVDQLIEEVIPLYRNIKVWNLSIGPQGPILDEVVSSLTRILDKVSYENDIMFVIAAGNTGNESGFSRRIQIPGDSVNNLTVSSYFMNKGIKSTSSYSSIGPGREGGKLKPDIVDHGGLLPIDPVYTVSTYEYLLNKVHGTSFAAPHITRKMGMILSQYPTLNVWEARALLEHSMTLRISESREVKYDGKGELDNGDIQLLTSNEDEVRILYSGTISAKGYVLLPIPIPQKTISKRATITWTIVTKTKVNPDNTDRYTEYGIEDDFFPNSEKFNFSMERKKKVIDISTIEGAEEAEVLLNNGYKRSSYPAKEAPKYMSESDRRRELLKWDTSKTQRVNKMVKSLKTPYIRLHGLSRSDHRDRIEYALVVTVQFHGDIDIYNNIMSEYPVLQSIQIREQSQQRI
ncbi:S8 family peptidase [Enterococcus sp. AD013-P3]|uniref:S8 family peptidase n=1 Tax=Enterococcus sp. AD013-P3 TaxID=3411036 RepID=UPI003B9522D4